MEHPLENPTLAPFELVTTFRKKRTNQDLTGIGTGINGDREILKIWSSWNRKRSPRPLPVEEIIHTIMPSQKKANCVTDGNFWFEGKPYLTRDIVVLSSVVCWFGTNCGRAFVSAKIHENDSTTSSLPLFSRRDIHPLREFITKFDFENGRPGYHKDLIAFWLHEECAGCKEGGRGWCDYNTCTVSDRDRAVVRALLWWLGNARGRSFLNAYDKRVECLFTQYTKNVRKQLLQSR